MTEPEVITCVKNHLQGRFNQIPQLTKQDKAYCIRMIMDFLPYMKKSDAQKFFEENILKDLTFDSTDISGIKYEQGDGGAWVHLTAYNLKVHIDTDNLKIFGKELTKLAKAYEALGVGW